MPCRVMLDQKPMRQVGVLATPDGSQNGSVIAFRVAPIAFSDEPYRRQACNGTFLAVPLVNY